MIAYQSFELANGLKVFVHEDHSTPMAAVNILYNVGSRDEDEAKTGFAHLFEHLMFGGSENIASYDEPLQQVGGENNAFTSPDITNYYVTLPASNIETAFWLESDRMKSLSFDPQVLEVQRKVVIEEFKQRYLNQPYGDVWLKLRPLAYEKHPYKWATIGKEISHIEEATMQDVKDFFFTYYLPNNAIMVVAGNVSTSAIEKLANKWFGDIPAGNPYLRNLPKEPQQLRNRELHTEANVPFDALYKVFHIPGRYETGYFEADLLADTLGHGKSSRLYSELVMKKPLFSNISASVTGSLEPGLLVINGNLNQGVSLEEANDAVSEVIDKLQSETFSEVELAKVKNRSETAIVFSEVELLNRAMSIAFAANSGNVAWCNQDVDKLRAVTTTTISNSAKRILTPENCSTLFYKAAQNS